jgi:hypothetical protein
VWVGLLHCFHYYDSICFNYFFIQFNLDSRNWKCTERRGKAKEWGLARKNGGVKTNCDFLPSNNLTRLINQTVVYIAADIAADILTTEDPYSNILLSNT